MSFQVDPFICAELSGNHQGSLERAFALVDAAKEAGADAIKTQCFDPETLTLDHDGPGFAVKEGLWSGRKLIDLYRETAMPWDWHAVLFAHARELGMEAFASVFCAKSVDHVASLQPCAMKIASLEIADMPLIRRAASKGVPVILSCGMASADEIQEAVEAVWIKANTATLLHCPAGYPSDADTANLGQIKFMAERYRVPVGLSDHSLSISLPAVAVALGATIIEKHLTLSRSDGGADAEFSLEPHEFKAMANVCREARAALSIPKNVSEPHRELRRSLYVVEDIAEGEEFSPDNVASIRPGYGMEPKSLPDVIGRIASQDLKRGTPLGHTHLRAEVREAVGRGRRVF